MGRDGAVESLFDKDLVGVLKVDVLGCCVSVKRELVSERDMFV